MTARKTTSLTMLLSFIHLVLTSVVLYVVPEGRVAYWSDWRWLGMTKSQWGDIHINLGWLFLAAGLLHLFFNWKPIIAYMKNKSRELKVFTADFNIALALTVVFTVGTLMYIPPFSSILDFGVSFKDAAAEKYGEPPYGHAELSSLKTLSRRMGLDLEIVQEQLKGAGIEFTGKDQTVLEIAKANKVTPKVVYDSMKKAEEKPEPGVVKAFPSEPAPGLGRMILGDICAEYNLDTASIVKALEAKGVHADPTLSLKAIATENNTDPHALYEILYEVAVQ